MPDCTFVPVETVMCCVGFVNFIFIVALLVSIFSKKDIIFFCFPRSLVSIMAIITLMMFNTGIISSQVSSESDCTSIYRVGE